MQFNILDPQLYAGDPFPVYKWLRDNDPVFWDERNSIWVISKYADVAYVSKNPKIFCSRFGVTPDADVQISMVTMDDPRHTKLRSIVSRGFTPRMVATLEPRLRQIVRECIDDIADKGDCDFVPSLAVPVPLLVIAEMIGIPREDRQAFWHWSDTMILAAGQQNNPDILQKASEAFLEYANYLQRVFEDRRQHPKDDLVSILLAAQDGGQLTADEENLSADELLMFMTLLMVAGNETTRNGMSGGMLVLSENPDEYRRLVANPELLPSAVEEILRWTAPIVGFRRTATQDTELRGKKIREGDKVLMLYQSANRDEEVFAEPDRFLIDRQPNDHLTFGIGTHFCLGANLARMEIRTLFEELIRRVPDIQVAPGAQPVRVPSPLVRGISSLPVTFTPERQTVAASA